LAKPNYQFAKRQRDLAKRKKQEEKRRRKLEKKDAGQADDVDTSPNGDGSSTPGEQA